MQVACANLTKINLMRRSPSVCSQLHLTTDMRSQLNLIVIYIQAKGVRICKTAQKECAFKHSLAGLEFNATN